MTDDQQLLDALKKLAAELYTSRERVKQLESGEHEPIAVVARSVDNEAPYFVDYIGDYLDEAFPGITSKAGALDIYTTLDLNLSDLVAR